MNDEVKHLRKLLKEFFKYLEYTETNDDGKPFHPIMFHCARVMMTKDFGLVLSEMKAESMKGNDDE